MKINDEMLTREELKEILDKYLNYSDSFYCDDSDFPYSTAHHLILETDTGVLIIEEFIGYFIYNHLGSIYLYRICKPDFWEIDDPFDSLFCAEKDFFDLQETTKDFLLNDLNDLQEY